MKTEYPVELLLRWRLARAEAGAPPAPRAAHLLELARPWWDTWPERFRTLAQRLNAIPVAYGHAMSEPRPAPHDHLVPALLVRTEAEFETTARLLYLSIRDGQLRLRFQLDAAVAEVAPAFDVTFVEETSGAPLLSAAGLVSVDSEYRIEADLPPTLAAGWQALRVTDRMPFRFILRPATDRD